MSDLGVEYALVDPGAPAPAAPPPWSFFVVSMRRQQQPLWCWASVAQAVGRVLGMPRTQRDIASHVLGRECDFEGCNVRVQLPLALRAVQVPSTYQAALAPPGYVQHDASRRIPVPIAVRWWYDEPHHFLILAGERLWDGPDDELFVYDPRWCEDERGFVITRAAFGEVTSPFGVWAATYTIP